MLKFKTDIPITEIVKPKIPIGYESKVLLLGSCFVENVGQRLESLKFNGLTNPFGVLFHPIAIEKVLDDVVQQRYYSECDLIFDQGLWHSPHHHSEFSSPNSDEVLAKIMAQQNETFEFLQQTSHCVITLGTAWVYQYIPTQQVVANCHKIPQKQFEKRLLTVEEIEKRLQNISRILKKINPSVQIILTLSPVRHLKDGFQNNAISKAHLLTGIHRSTMQESMVYFPAYEILTDDLRDYRFYAGDMIHPSEMAVNYIWEIFKSVWLSTETQLVTEKVVQLQRDLQHKPFHPQSERYQLFLKQIESQKNELSEKYGVHF